MLQYPVQLPPLSLSSNSSSKDQPEYFRHNDSSRLSSSTLINSNSKRFQKESPVSRSAFLPSAAVPFSISTNLSHSHSPTASPSIPATKFSRSPYISARQLSNTAPVSVPATNSHSWASKSPVLSNASSVASSSIEDVLAPGDVVAEGGTLQGETIRLVSVSSSADSELPSREFEVVRRLGAGSYAVVYLVVEVLSRPPVSEDGHMSTIGPMEINGSISRRPDTVYGREYAIKCLSKANLDEDALTAQMSEVTIHQSLYAHPNIAALYCTLETPSFLLLLLEYVPGEDLFYFLEQSRDHYELDSTDPTLCSSRTPPTPSLLSNMHPSQLLSRTRLRLIASMFSQMCDAVAACHTQQVFHRDIKPENFIVTDGWTTLPNGRQERKVVVKLTDFGLSTTDVESSDMDCGSAPYMSYECRNNVAPTYRPRAADVWSLGIVLINMLYHYNPWTDTAQGVCSSFSLFRSDPIKFFMTRFTGMTLQVAEYLANKVFCLLPDPKDDSRRATASEFSAWVKDLPDHFGSFSGIQRTVSVSSSQGHPIASTPISRRPSSRHPSGLSTAIRTPAIPSRSLSRAPSLGPAYEEQEKFELSTVYDHEVEEQSETGACDNQVIDKPEMTTRSTSTSTTKRRKRGARKNKSNPSATPSSPTDDALASLADASQSLAREISRASKASSHSVKPASPTVPAPPVPTKKPSKWKLSFGKSSGSSVSGGRASPAEDAFSGSAEMGQLPGMSATASNVTNLIMGLSPAPVHAHSPPSRYDDEFATWGRGRRNRNPMPNRGQPGYAGPSNAPARVEHWIYPDRRSDRAVSPSSTRSGRPVASSASSVVSDNWRSSMSTTSSAYTSTSAFTRYSNSSTRSISTTATSVSSAPSWRTGPKSQPSSTNAAYPAIPKNIKPLNGVPWELDQLPRGQHPNPVGDIFGSPPARKQRPRKPKDPKLDTITERPTQKSPLSMRKDASTSTTDLADGQGAGKGEGETVKKVQKGQINALAKMLSALRR